MAQPLKADTASQVVRIGPAVSVSDGFTAVTSLALTTADEAVIIKNDGTVVDISGGTWTFAAVTGSDSMYDLTIKNTDVSLEGKLEVIITDVSLCLPIVNRFEVLSEAAYDSLYATDTGAGMKTALIDDAITASKYDETTAFPQTASVSAAVLTNFILQYDGGAGLLGDPFPFRQDQGTTLEGGVTLEHPASADVVTDGVATNDYTATAVHDGTLFIVTDNDNSDPGIDTYLDFVLDSNTAAFIHFHGWFNDGAGPATNTCLMQNRNWAAATWETIHTLTSAGSEEEHDPAVLARHRSTLANGPGGVENVTRTRFVMAAQDTGSGSTINIDHCVAKYVVPGLTAADVWGYITRIVTGPDNITSDDSKINVTAGVIDNVDTVDTEVSANVTKYGGSAGTFSGGRPAVNIINTAGNLDTIAKAVWESAVAGYGSADDFSSLVQELQKYVAHQAWINFHLYVRLNHVSGMPVTDITGFTVKMSSTGMFNNLKDIDVGSIDSNGAWTPGADQGSDLWTYPMIITLTGAADTQLDDDIIFDLQVSPDNIQWDTIMRINLGGLAIGNAKEGYLQLDASLWHPGDDFNFPNKVNTNRGTDFLDLISTDAQDRKASLTVDIGAISGDSAAADRLELFSEYQSYPNRRVHVDTVTGDAGDTDHENGTLLNPSSVWADALTIAGSLNLSGFQMYPGSSITLTEDHANNIFQGESWIIATAGYDLSNSYIYDAFVNGGESTSDTQNANFVRCLIWSHTSGSAVFRECAIANDFTIGEAGSYTFVDCFEAGGTSQAAIDFAALGATEVQFDRWSGAIEIKNMAAGDVLNMYGDGGIIINANCSGGTINRIGGSFDITDNASGSVTITNEVARYASDVVRDEVWAYIMSEIPVSTDPGATPTAAQALMLEYMKSRNRHDASTTEESIYNDAGAKILERDLTDDTVTASASKVRNPT